MKVEIGTKGLLNSWQDDFNETANCPKCNGVARIAFVVQEIRAKDFVYELHENKNGERWPHDAIAVAVYFCKNCFEAVTIWNQA